MTGNHVSFTTMSDLLDGLVLDQGERDLLAKHIHSCPGCSLEYGRLEKMLRLCRQAGERPLAPASFSPDTMLKIQAARVKKTFIKSLPAIAASLLVIAGVGFFNAGIAPFNDRVFLADDDLHTSRHDSELVLDIIRKHKASISQVTDQYVEGTVPVASFSALRRNLGYRRVAYMPAEESDPGFGIHWGDAIEEVGLGNGQPGRVLAPLHDYESPEKYIRFRVYR